MKPFEAGVTPLPPPQFLFSIIFVNTPPTTPTPIPPSPYTGSEALLWFVSTLKLKSWMESLFFISMDYRTEEEGDEGGWREISITDTLSLSFTLGLARSPSLILSAQVWTWTARTFAKVQKRPLSGFEIEKGFRFKCSLWVFLQLVSGFKPSLCVLNMYHLLSNVCLFLLCYYLFDQWHCVAHTHRTDHM